MVVLLVVKWMLKLFVSTVLSVFYDWKLCKYLLQFCQNCVILCKRWTQLKIVRIYLPGFIWNYLSPLSFCSLKKHLLGRKHVEILSRAEIQILQIAQFWVGKMGWLVVKNHFEDLQKLLCIRMERSGTNTPFMHIWTVKCGFLRPSVIYRRSLIVHLHVLFSA